MRAGLTLAKVTATAAVAVCVLVVIPGGAGGAASVPAGRIVFSSPLPAYPLPDNFEQPQHFSIRLDGRDRREIHWPAHWSWRDATHIYVARDGSAGAEVWVEHPDGTAARRLAVLAGSGPVTDMGVSPDGSKLYVVAGALWVVGSSGSSPHTVFAPAAGSTVSNVTWSRNGSRLVFVSNGLWSARADGSGATHLFATTDWIRYYPSPTGTAYVVLGDGSWLVPSDGATPTELAPEGDGAVAWTRDGTAFALEEEIAVNCRPGQSNCVAWYVLVFSRNGSLLARLDRARAPRWSPDGKRLVFEAGPLGPDPEDGTIGVAQRDGSGRHSVSGRLAQRQARCWRNPVWEGNTRVSFDESDCDFPDRYPDPTRSVVVDASTGRLLRSVFGTDISRSPGDKRVAYLHAAAGNDVQLYVTTSVRGKPLRLSPLHGYVDQADWSPDGRRIAFTMETSDCGGNSEQQVYVVSSHGGRPRQVTHELSGSSEGSFVWSRDGRTLFYESDLDSNARNALWTVDAAGAGAHRLTHDRTDDLYAAWSHDGRHVAYAAYCGDDAAIDVVNADGTGVRRIVGKPGESDTSPAWSPDGKRLAFVRSKGGSLFLGVVNADGTGVHILKDAGNPYGTPTWSPDGGEIVFSDSGTDLVAVAPDGTNPHPLIQHDCTPMFCTRFEDAAFSPDGSRIAVSCNDCGAGPSNGIWVLRADGSDLTPVAAGIDEHPTWSPDGSSIAFSGDCSANSGGYSQLCIVGADGSNLHAATDWPFGIREPSWSPG
jgi:Tol biopolymer transport system component